MRRLHRIVGWACLLAGCAPAARPEPHRPDPVPDAREARVVFDFYPPRAYLLDPEALVVTFDDGSGPRTAAGSEFTTQGYAIPHSAAFRTRTAGELRVRAVLLRGDTLGVGELRLPLRPDWTWSVSVHADTANPLRGCFGCLGARGFPLRAGAGLPVDSLYLVWSGNSISAPVVY